MQRFEDDRLVDERRQYRDVGDDSTVRWSPPPPRTGLKAATFGTAALMRATDDLLNGATRDAGRRLSWSVWSIGCVWQVPAIFTDHVSQAPTERRRLAVKSRKLGRGVELVGEGDLVPQYVLRADGWRLDATRVPTAT